MSDCLVALLPRSPLGISGAAQSRLFFLDYPSVSDTTVLLNIRVSLSVRIKKAHDVFQKEAISCSRRGVRGKGGCWHDMDLLLPEVARTPHVMMF